MTWPHQRQFWLAVSGFVMVEVMSWLAYTLPHAEQIVTVVIALAALLLAWKQPRWLAYATVAELVVGSKGYLFFAHPGSATVSIRMALFCITVMAALPLVVRQWRGVRKSVLSKTFLLFIGWIIIAMLIGIIRNNGLNGVYTDANAFIYLALLPAWWVLLRGDPKWRTNMLLVLMAGATVIGIKSWLAVLLFGKDIAGIHTLYAWIRNTGVGEVTYINSNIFRVFFQSQIYSLLTLCFLLAAWTRQQVPRWIIWPLAATALGLYISLSRSFWLGFAVFFIVLVVWLVRRKQWVAFQRLAIIVPLGIFAWAMMIWALSFPSWSLSAGHAGSVVSRLQGGGASAASTARVNQIQPLLRAIGHHPVLGSGFGTPVTYFSTDPTVHGWRTTSAFELGYFDLWLKIGLVGLLLYAAWILQLWRKLFRTTWGLIFITASVALVVTHLTSPYLNHPLGLGWLMIISLYAHDPA